MVYEIRVHREVGKFLNDLDSETKERIKKLIKELSENPFENRVKVDIKRLKGTKKREDLFRLRIGDFRVVYAIEENVVWITDVWSEE